MQLFTQKWIVPLAEKQRWKKFCEIGASTGLGTNEILRLPNISHTIIDPCLDADLALRYANNERVVVLKSNSLDALPNITGSFDCILIDGDHNWYTVFNELRLIHQRNLLRSGGMIFFHDVGWPYGRRDMYYQPDTIPPEFRLDYERKGVIQGQSQLDSGGKNPHLDNATAEGGPGNGVLTAIEDFLSDHPSEYRFCRVKVQYGLGILQHRSKRPTEHFSFMLLRFKVGIYNLYRLVRYIYKLMRSSLASVKVLRSLVRKLKK